MRKLIVNAHQKGRTIQNTIYGHFSEHLGHCIYGGLFVGEDSEIPHENGMRADIVAALRQIRTPVLRWPGGCFADEYHWRDGIGPKENRKRMINTHWGGVVEDNSFGTHEFLELCRQIGCEPYIAGNVGSGTIQEMSEWVEYMTFAGVSPLSGLRAANGHAEPWKVKYFGVGNENWGCGGNMTAEYYAHEYRRFQTYVRNYGDNKIYRIACGPSSDDYEWTDTLMKIAGKKMDGLALHHYTICHDWSHKGSATVFTEEEYYKTLKAALRMDSLITNHSRIMDVYDPEKRVGLVVDEWGAWYDVEPGTNPGFLYQQNTMRDAVLAAVTFNIFNRHCERVTMANLAQTVNVLQSVALTDGEKMLLTPTWHVFDLYKEHQDATLVESYIEADEAGPEAARVPDLHVSASINAEGRTHITLANLSATENHTISASISGASSSEVTARILTGAMNAHNDFDHPDRVAGQAFTEIERTDGGLTFTLPACSVLAVTLG